MAARSKSTASKKAPAKKATANKQPTQPKSEDVVTTALALAREGGVMKADAKGREYVDIDFDLSPEGDFTEDNAPVGLSVCKLLQALSLEVVEQEIEGAAAGVYCNVETQELFDTLDVTVLYRYDERYMNADSKNVSSEQVCSSREGKGKFGLCTLDSAKEYGIPLVKISDPVTKQEVPAGNCATCPNAMFGRDAQGNPTRPNCRHVTWLVCIPNELLDFSPEFMQLLVDQDEDTIDNIINGLMAVPFGGKARRVFDKQIYKILRRAKALYGLSWEFGSKLTKEPKGTYYLITAKPGEVYTKEQRVLLRSLSNLVGKLHPVMSEQLQSRIDVSDYEPGEDNTPDDDTDAEATDVDVE